MFFTFFTVLHEVTILYPVVTTCKVTSGVILPRVIIILTLYTIAYITCIRGEGDSYGVGEASVGGRGFQDILFLFIPL